MLKRILVLLVLLAVAAVPLAQAGGESTPPASEPILTESTPASTASTGATAPPPATGVPTSGVIADGVTIEGLLVGGMTDDEATEAVIEAFEEQVQFRYKKRRWWADPSRLGAKVYAQGAVRRALLAPSGAAVDLVVKVKGSRVDDYVAYLNRNFSRNAKDSTLRLVKLRPKISKARVGFKVDNAAMKVAIVRTLKSLDRKPIRLEGTVLEPQQTLSNYGSVVVIRRESKRLYLYNGQRFVRRFGVATGQPSYPTPLGRWEIVTKQRNPWWYPPQDSDWAKGQEPVPPGPGNPLGTRWMGISAPLVGIHGTPDAASIGYSASHGCVRMHVSEAEWLFDHVDLGTPVFIVSA